MQAAVPGDQGAGRCRSGRRHDALCDPAGAGPSAPGAAGRRRRHTFADRRGDAGRHGGLLFVMPQKSGTPVKGRDKRPPRGPARTSQAPDAPCPPAVPASCPVGGAGCVWPLRGCRGAALDAACRSTGTSQKGGTPHVICQHPQHRPQRSVPP